jgi:hypothetical protein
MISEKTSPQVPLHRLGSRRSKSMADKEKKEATGSSIEAFSQANQMLPRSAI